MKRFLGAATALIAATALAAQAGAQVATPGGATCSANSTSPTVIVVIFVISPNAPVWGGAEFGASGLTFTNVTIPGYTGTVSSSGLSPGMSIELLGTAPLAPGTHEADLTLGSPFSGQPPVMMAGSNTPPSTFYYDPVTCTWQTTGTTSTTTTPSNIFVPATGTLLPNATGFFDEPVNAPGPGLFLFSQGPGTHTVLHRAGEDSTSKLLIQPGTLVVKKAAKVPLVLKPTAAGRAVLSSKGSISLNLKITFTPKGGKPASKVVKLTLKAHK
jgi:hypothetical protein